ncbi:MAG: LemA family protein [Opitutales bacterium]|nr:LemA family protein [Opitutales bacterium]
MIVLLSVVGVLLLIAALWAVSVYNGLVALRNQIKNAFAQIDVQLQRRYDLIPNLVETAKGFLKHERETLQAVTEARNAAMSAAKAASANPTSASAIAGLGVAEGALSGALSRMMLVAEAYPDLKSDRHMAQLMEELASTENKVAFARQAYNDTVMVYNTKRESFPAVMIAGTFGFEAMKQLEIETPEARKNVKVQF